MATKSPSTTFVVSLFLPYTINFASPTSPGLKFAKPADPGQVQVAQPLFSEPSNLASATPPGSPEHQETNVFGPELDVSTRSIHFAKPNNPRTLARSDAHVPEWGRGRVYNQPLAKGSLAPPSTILAYSKSHEQNAAARLDTLHTNNLSRTRERDSVFTPVRVPRDPSREKSISRAGWTVEPAVQGNGGLTNAVRAAEDDGIIESNVMRIGTLGFPTDDLGFAKRDEIIETLEAEYDSLCVVVSDKDFDSHYRQFCKTILWPVFHYQIPDHPKSKAYEDHSWIYYVKINEAFAEKIIENYKHGDTIWIHDYHLFLVPLVIRKKLPDAKIGFFLHIAFPSSEVFRCLASRKQLLCGVLGANVIVFQTSEYAQHFLQTCSRLLVVETTEHGVQVDTGHFVEVAYQAIGIVPEQLSSARSEPEVQNWINTLTSKYKDKILIVARDKLDSIRGVKQKLLAFEMFLNDHPEWKGRVVLIQVATSAASDQDDLNARVSEIVTRVNSKHSTLEHQPVLFLRQDIAFHQYLALLSAADVLMITSLREGMNLTCHEYITCQDGLSGSHKKYGPLILSEFAGSAEVFEGNEIAVNPWDYKQMARAIRHALEMSSEEKHSRWVKLSQRIIESNGIVWVKQLQSRLNAAWEIHHLRDTMSIPRLSVQALSDAYYHAKTALIILDLEGTLLPHNTTHSGGDLTAPQRLIDILNELVLMTGNMVYVTSARTKADLERCFWDVPGLGLIAENGCFVRPFAQGQWVDLANTSVDHIAEWKPGVLSLLSYYRQRQKGSWIEEKVCTVVYHYADVPASERDAAFKQAGDAANHINDSCQGQRMRAVPLDKAVVIEPYDIDKSTAADWVLRNKCSRRAKSGKHPNEHDADDNATADYFQEEHEAIEQPTTLPLTEPLAQLLISNPHAEADLSDSLASTPPSGVTTPGHLLAPPPSASSDRIVLRDQFQWPDFLLVAGDDREDEPLFRWANELSMSPKGEHSGGDDAASTKYDGKIRDVFSICVGKKNTEASCTLTSGAMGLVAALQKLTSA